MSWENSKALTPLKRDFLKRFAAANRAFFLTGGSALGIFYLEHRLSYDLDFFAGFQALRGPAAGRNGALELSLIPPRARPAPVSAGD